MKRLTLRSRAIISTAAVCLVSVLRLNAQTTAPAPGATTNEESEEILVLSPFIVDAAEDAGSYAAKSTLAGSRIRTELRDIASPIEVVTAQLLRDTASHNNQDLLTYTTSTEVGGLYGNWGGFGNGQGISDRSSLLQPNQNTRVRGLDQADNTRNFFLSDIPWDGYNVERVEIQRGPNSILFGVGSPAGIINTSTIQAKFSGKAGKVENQFGSHGSSRWTLDYNAELVDDIVAVRIAAVKNDQKYRQKPAFNNEERFFGTLSFEPQMLPSSWAGKLSIRASTETAAIKANRPRNLPPEDAISLWFDDVAGDGVTNRIGFGKGVMDMFLYSQRGGGDPGRGSAAGGDVANGGFYILGVTPLDGGALNNGGIGFFYKNGSSTPFFVSRQAPRAFPGALAPSGAIDNTIDIPYGTMTRVGGLNAYAYQIDQLDTAEGRASRFPLASRGYYKDTSLTDPTIFNFYNQLIDGDNKREYQDWDADNISVAQTFFNNRLGLEFVWDKQIYSHSRGGSAWNRPYISVDINKNLQHQFSQYTRDANNKIIASSYSVPGFTPTAAQPYVNANAGAAFISGSFSNNDRLDRERESTRLTAYGELRAEDFLNKDSMLARILGRHALTGLLTREKRHEANTIWTPSATPYAWARGLSVNGENTALGEAPRGITPLIYLTEPLFNRTSASGLNIGPITTYYNPSGVYSVNHFKAFWKGTANPAAPWTNFLGSTTSTQSENPANYLGWVNAPVGILNADNGDRSQLILNYDETDQIIDSQGFVWQGHLLGGHLVPTVGWREDTLGTHTAKGAKDPTGIVATSIAGGTKPALESTGETTSWGVVAHLPAKWAQKIPGISGLSAFYNYGENARVESRYNYDGEPLENASAESVDYGIVISALDDKLTFKAGKFETKIKNGNLPGGGSLIGANQYYLYQLEAWGTANSLLYLFGREGLDPNQNWHWNWALVDDNAWGNSAYDPNTTLFKTHPSSVKQAAAVDAWFAGLDAQFFKNYSIPADVNALKAAYSTYKSSGNIAPLVAAAAASGFPVGTYTTGFSSQNDGRINGISPNGTIDNTSRGYEFELNWQPNSNWNIKVNAAKTTAYRESLGAPMLDFINKQYARIKGPAGDIRLWWGGEKSIRTFYEDNIISAVKFQQESIGFLVPELRPKRLSVMTNYNFTEGRIKGFNVGGVFRWEDKQILGYGLKTDKSGLDVEKPLFGDSDQHLDIWIGYERKLTDRINWRIQANVRNVGESKGLTPISVNPDGTVAAQRIMEGMGWSLTNSFSF